MLVLASNYVDSENSTESISSCVSVFECRGFWQLWNPTLANKRLGWGTREPGSPQFWYSAGSQLQTRPVEVP